MRAEPIFFVLLIGALWLAGRSRGVLSPLAQLALLGTGIGGLLAIRNIVWFALVGAAVLPVALDGLRAPTKAPRHRNVNLALTFGALIVLVGSFAATAAHSRSWFEHDYLMASGRKHGRGDSSARPEAAGVRK